MFQKIPSKSLPLIVGISSFKLNEEEITFLQKYRPFGIILFKRNIDNINQVKELTNSIKEILGVNTPILIDQEGGRVARLTKDYWPVFPNMQELIKQKNPEIFTYNNFISISSELNNLGVNVNCAPVADLIIKDAHDIIGDRSFGECPEIVAKYSNIVIDAHVSKKILPIIKHIPGHGRALADSHLDLPIVKTDLKTLQETDFKAFKLICQTNKNPYWAMTAHIIYEALDKKNPATLSKIVIDYIKQDIGFKNLIVTDDLSMKALHQNGDNFTKISEKALKAGCDILLHCNGDMSEMLQITKLFK